MFDNHLIGPWCLAIAQSLHVMIRFCGFVAHGKVGLRSITDQHAAILLARGLKLLLLWHLVDGNSAGKLCGGKKWYILCSSHLFLSCYFFVFLPKAFPGSHWSLINCEWPSLSMIIKLLRFTCFLWQIRDYTFARQLLVNCDYRASDGTPVQIERWRSPHCRSLIGPSTWRHGTWKTIPASGNHCTEQLCRITWCWQSARCWTKHARIGYAWHRKM